MASLISGTGTKAGTAGGTLLTVLSNISTGDLVHTSVLAAVGALVSFTVSIILKWLIKALSKRNRPKKPG